MKTTTLLVLAIALAETSVTAAESSEDDDAVTIRMLLNGGKRRGEHSNGCTRPEIDSVIKSVMLWAAAETIIAKVGTSGGFDRLQQRPNLRSGSSKAIADEDESSSQLYCTDYCQGFDAGACWIVDSTCAAAAAADRRKHVTDQDATTADQNMNSNGSILSSSSSSSRVEPALFPDHVNDDEAAAATERELMTGDNNNGSSVQQRVTCETARHAVLQQLIELASSSSRHLTNSCKHMLLLQPQTTISLDCVKVNTTDSSNSAN